MYPDRELTRLAAAKVALRRTISARRARCVRDASRAMQPLELLDRVLSFWRRLPLVGIFATMPIALLVQNAVSPRFKILRLLMRWSPLVFGVVRVVRRAVRIRVAPSQSSNG